MKKYIFAFLFILAAGFIFAQDIPGNNPNPSPSGMLDTVILNAAIVLAIYKGVSAFKRLLESKWLVWILKLTGHTEVVPFVSIALTICAGLLLGIAAYGMDGLTIKELWKLGADILIANGVFIHAKEQAELKA